MLSSTGKNSEVLGRASLLSCCSTPRIHNKTQKNIGDLFVFVLARLSNNFLILECLQQLSMTFYHFELKIGNYKSVFAILLLVILLRLRSASELLEFYR